MTVTQSVLDASSVDTVPFTRLFEARVERTPESIAVVFEGDETSYDELNRRANRLARFLLERGFQPEDRIGICLDRSTAAITAMLGILKSGCAFVPLDPEFPPDRLAYIVDHASIKLILCDEIYRKLFAETDTTEIIEAETSELDGYGTENLDLDIPPDSLAYVMYTSGSTGKPKGVQIEHRSLTTYCLADVDVYRLDASDRTLQFSTLNFDVAIEEIYPPLLVGSTVVVRPRQRAEAAIELSHLIETHQVTALHIATAYWNEWVDLMEAAQVRVPSSLRLVIVTGEKMSVEHYRRWQSLCDHEILWCNAYGPTETTVTCTVFIPPTGWHGKQMPIGKPLPGYQAFILDEAGKPVKDGETGHLFIGGPALARGYLDRPDLTEKAFLCLKFEGEIERQRLYRTGDLARWLPDGNIEFSGRVDHQMKIGSYRIEPGEIESIIHLNPDVRESLVVCEEVDGQKYLVAYVVPNDKVVEAGELADFLRGRLPAYMVPTRFVFLDSMPKTINGKIDRAALPSSKTAVVARGGEQRRAETPLEKELAAIWCRVLNLPDVGVDDDFFLLGGSSLLVTRVIAQIADKLKHALPVRDFFANPTIAGLAMHLEATIGSGQVDCERRTQLSHDLRHRLPTVVPWSVESLGCRLSAVLYRPPASSKPRDHALVVVPSYGHEYVRAHRNLQQLAVCAAQNGFHVTRFDLAGTGDSDGDVERLSWDQWKADVVAVVQGMRSQGIGRISLLGVRLGANLASQAESAGLEHLIAWDPIENGAGYLANLRGFHRYELKGLNNFLVKRRSGAEELLGYPWPTKLQRDIEKLSEDERFLNGASAKHRCRLVTSNTAYSQSRRQSCLTKNAENDSVFGLTDVVLWDDRRYTNKAFASPDLYRNVLRILESGGS